MSISEVQLSNFKSFYKASTVLNKFNVVVGANASGKSNFVQFFKFIKDIRAFGLDDAISMQGGAEYLFNANHQNDNVLYGKIVNDTKQRFIPRKRMGIGFEVFRNSYEIEIEASYKRTYVKSISDKLISDCRFFKYERLEEDEYEYKELEPLGEGQIGVFNVDRVISLDIGAPTGVDIESLKENSVELKVFEDFLTERNAKLGKKQSLLESTIVPPWALFGHEVVEIIHGIAIYDIDPKLTKRAQPVTGRHDLESDGSNLAAVIRRLSKNTITKREMENIIKELLPFVEGISIKKLEDNVIIRVKEKFKSSNMFPAFLLSDGTLNLTALSVALFFENKPFKVIEEPERNIHPHLISKIMTLMREASEESQIITTSHNPEIVKHANIDELMLVSRNRFGDSVLSRPGEQKDIREFLSNKLGIEELYIQNILEKYRSKEDV